MSDDRDDAPSRDQLERGLRFANLLSTTVQQNLLDLAAQVQALTAELERKNAIDRAAIDREQAELIEEALSRNEDQVGVRVELGLPGDKYDTPSPEDLDCAALFHLCKAKCCSFHFALTTQDLDEGVVRWDYGRPYVIAQSPDNGRCVHLKTGGGCGVYEHRPAACRRYDCRNDKRIWLDFDKKIPAPVDGRGNPPD